MTHRKAKILVTGASGFLGRAVVGHALVGGANVRALVRSRSKSGSLLPNACEVVEGDVLDKASMSQAMQGMDVVIHLAFAMHGDEAEQMKFANTGIQALVDAMQSAGVKRLVLASSFSVYAGRAVASGVLDEASPIEKECLNQRDGYTRAKIEQERQVQAACKNAGIELVILRPGVIWGAGRTQPFCIGQKLGPMFAVIGKGRSVGFTYVENCAQAFVAATTCICNEMLMVCNITDDEDTTVSDFLNETQKFNGVRHRLSLPFGLGLCAAKMAWAIGSTVPPIGKRLPRLLRPAAYQARFPGAKTPNQHAKQSLDWEPRLSFKESWEHAANAAGSTDV